MYAVKCFVDVLFFLVEKFELLFDFVPDGLVGRSVVVPLSTTFYFDVDVARFYLLHSTHLIIPYRGVRT